MKIIRLNEIQFNNYSNIHSHKNICQTLEYSSIKENRNNSKEFLGLLDENNNVCAGCLIIKKYVDMNTKMGYIPGGFLIDYNNYVLLNIFIQELKKFLSFTLLYL